MHILYAGDGHGGRIHWEGVLPPEETEIEEHILGKLGND